jgi:AcrR family transcriptional regulator
MVKQKADAAPTRQRIVGLAVDLFYEQGYNATSLRQVAEAVGVQVGSLYNHMSSKEELLFDIMRSIMDDLIADAEVALAQAGHEPLDRIMAFMRTSIRFHCNSVAVWYHPHGRLSLEDIERILPTLAGSLVATSKSTT